MTIRMYVDEVASQVFVEHGNVGTWPFGSLQAIGNGDGTVSVRNRAKQARSVGDLFLEIADVAFADFVDFGDNPWGGTEAGTVNALNAMFVDAPETGVPPVYTGATAVTVTDAEAVNYLATADGGVGWEWLSMPAGLAVASHNPRNLIGVFSGGAGTYPVSVTATNYYGSTTTTITFTVTATFADTRSMFCEDNDYLDAAATTANPFYRSGNGAGAADAWTASLWFRPSTANQRQTILSFGGDDEDNETQVRFEHEGGKRFRLQYGSKNNYLRLATPDNSLVDGQWHHIFVTYDGGTTGVSGGSLSDYYGRFEIWIDGIANPTTNSHKNNGTSAAVLADTFRVGELTTNGDHLRGAHVNELALWGADRSADIATIYNGGVPHDLSVVATPPTHWWRMGDGDTYPLVEDQIGSLDFTMFNMTAANIATVAP